MKVTQETPGFKPVVVTLESIGEVAMLAAVLSSTSQGQDHEAVMKEYGGAIHDALVRQGGDPGYALYEQLNAIVKENKCLLR